MQGQITTPACITHRNRVNKNKNSNFEAVHVERIELKDPALRNLFTHHYTTSLFVNIFGVAISYTMCSRVKMVKSEKRDR